MVCKTKVTRHLQIFGKHMDRFRKFEHINTPLVGVCCFASMSREFTAGVSFRMSVSGSILNSSLNLPLPCSPRDLTPRKRAMLRKAKRLRLSDSTLRDLKVRLQKFILLKIGTLRNKPLSEKCSEEKQQSL